MLHKRHWDGILTPGVHQRGPLELLTPPPPVASLWKSCSDLLLALLIVLSAYWTVHFVSDCLGSLTLKHRIHDVGSLITTKMATISWIPTNSPYEAILITSLVISRFTKQINQQIYQAWRRSFIPSCEGKPISTLGWAASSACCPQAKRASKNIISGYKKTPWEKSKWSETWYLIERSGDSAFQLPFWRDSPVTLL